MAEECKGITGAFPQRNYDNDKIIVNTDNLFNYNNILNTVQIYNGVNYAINIMTGIDSRWFRAVPELASKDVIFLEYTLSSVDPTPICIKLIVPNGQFPDAKNNYDLLGLEYEIPLEVQMDFKYWSECAGEGTMPQKGDIVYIPLSNKLYEVNSASEVRGFMEQITGWKCNLVKYVPSKARTFNVDEDTNMSLEDTLSKYTASVESLMGDEIRDDIEKLTSPSQTSPHLNSKRDIYKKLSNGLETKIEKLYAANTLFADSYYDFTSNKGNKTITYTYIDNIYKESERSFYAWVNPQKHGRLIDVQSIECVSKNIFKIKLKSIASLEIGSYVTLSKTESLYFNAKIISNENGFYNIHISDYFINKLYKLKTNWYNITGYKLSNSQVNLIQSKFITVSLLNRKIILIELNNQIFEVILEKTLLPNKWYSIFVNFSNTLAKLGVNIWESNEMYSIDKNANQLELLNMHSWDITPFEMENIEYVVNNNNSYLTNIRLSDIILVEAKNQINELISMYTKHSDKYLIIDNADIITNMIYKTENR